MYSKSLVSNGLNFSVYFYWLWAAHFTNCSYCWHIVNLNKYMRSMNIWTQHFKLNETACQSKKINLRRTLRRKLTAIPVFLFFMLRHPGALVLMVLDGFGFIIKGKGSLPNWISSIIFLVKSNLELCCYIIISKCFGQCFSFELFQMTAMKFCTKKSRKTTSWYKFCWLKVTKYLAGDKK